MREPTYIVGTVLLGVAASLAMACGGSSQHQIQSINISPATAEAATVQFVAAGAYTTPPMKVSPLQATWGVVDQSGGQTTNVSINATGLARCSSGVPGVYTVGAWVPLSGSPPKGSCNVVSPFGNSPCDSVLGMAQLTCP